MSGTSYKFALQAGANERLRRAFDALVTNMPSTEAEWAAAEWRQTLQAFRVEWLS